MTVHSQTLLQPRLNFHRIIHTTWTNRIYQAARRRAFYLTAALLLPAAAGAEAFSTWQPKTGSALSTASFGTFTDSYDHTTDGLHWLDYNRLAAAAYTGIQNNYLNMNGTVMLSDIYLAARFYQRIANYQDWPENMTDLYVDVFAGFNNGLSVKASYYDFCFSAKDDGTKVTVGKGKIKPGLELAYVFGESESGSRLRVSARADYQQLYWKSNLVDLRQASGSFRAAYGKDADNSTGAAYTFIKTFNGTNNCTDTDGIPVYHKFELYMGRTWQLNDTLRTGIRPNVFVVRNAIKPTGGPVILNPLKTGSTSEQTTYNEVPDNDTEASLRLPLSVEFCPLNDKIEFTATIMFGLYYATFDHLDSTCMGGCNKAGWVPEPGIGFGLNFTVTPKCTVQAGIQYVRVPEYDGSSYGYKESGSGGITAASLGSAPLSLSVALQL